MIESRFCKRQKMKKCSSPERFELSRGNPMYLAGTRLNHSAKATVVEGNEIYIFKTVSPQILSLCEC